MKISKNDVLSYTPEGGRYSREGMAVVTGHRSDGSPIAIDTFWAHRDPLCDHVLTPGELADAELLFNLDDVREVGKSEFETFASSDRHLLTNQHGLRSTHYVVKDASPSQAVIVANKRAQVAATLSRIRSLRRSLIWQAQELIEAAGDCSDDELAGVCRIEPMNDVASWCAEHERVTELDATMCIEFGELLAAIAEARAC